MVAQFSVCFVLTFVKGPLLTKEAPFLDLLSLVNAGGNKALGPCLAVYLCVRKKNVPVVSLLNKEREECG